MSHKRIHINNTKVFARPSGEHTHTHTHTHSHTLTHTHTYTHAQIRESQRKKGMEIKNCTKSENCRRFYFSDCMRAGER